MKSMPLAIVFSVCFKVSSSSFACLQLQPEDLSVNHTISMHSQQWHMVLEPVGRVAAVIAARGTQDIFHHHDQRAMCSAPCPGKDQLVNHYTLRSG